MADLVFCPVEKIYGGDFVRKTREKLYINKYQLIEQKIVDLIFFSTIFWYVKFIKNGAFLQHKL